MRIKLLNKVVLVVGLAVLMCSFAMPASAITFTYTQKTGFDTTTGTLLAVSAGGANVNTSNDISWYQQTSGLPALPTSPTETAAPPPSGWTSPTSTPPLYNIIAWGGGGGNNNNGQLLTTTPWEDSNYSALRVLGLTGAVSTDSWVSISRLWHQNNSLPLSIYALAETAIHSALSIDTYNSPAGPITVNFTETVNQATCPSPNLVGSTCDDLFTFPNISFAQESFTLGGIEYTAHFRLANFVNSASDYPLTDSFGNSTVYTAEGQTSSMDVQMEITVPEPATLTLLGLGLIGLGFAKRRRNNG